MTKIANSNHHVLKTVIFTTIALIAFAGNSVLCRKALGEDKIDASGFTIIRLLSGAIFLMIILNFSNQNEKPKTKGNWYSSFILFIYATAFSFAYITLDTGTGALIAFGAVQITIIVLSVISGDKLKWSEALGTLIAFIGFGYLVSPGVNSPSLSGFILMSIAGIAWGIYTIKGQESKNPLRDTSFNFLRTIPFLLILMIFAIRETNYSLEGILLAVISGGITSGIGYTIWYMALLGLTKVQSAVVQLFVPVIAAFGGVLFVSEIITLRLTLSSLLVLGGILIVVLGKNFRKKASSEQTM